ncbi:MAG: fatty aldehyde-rating acyl-ACP reductase [Clostridia bacterium]|jgi:predicted amino acid dehydrogenase|nr:Shikimate/quinate 5-dehydrogenase [Clostridiales bacterium]MDK2986271.1 fatty aldehyde-rating acyl-ACP reductase [Clostridia bacterium]
MDKFAFIVHPIEYKDLSRKFKRIEKLPQGLVEKMMQFLPPLKVSEAKGIKSSHNEIEGYFLGCTLTSEQMLRLPPKFVINKIVKTGRLAEKLGAKIVGLGAMTSVVGDAGITIRNRLNIPVTTGNSYTIATAIEGVKKASEKLEIDLAHAEVVVVGANGSIGKVCAHLIARDCRYLTLVSRDVMKLRKTADEILAETGLSPKVTSDVDESLKSADIVISVTSAVDSVIRPEFLKSGALVCDVARPRDVSKTVAEKRDDILIIEGGLIEVPGDPDLGFNFGYPPKIALACMAETMILALERKYESFTLGRDISIEQVDEISNLAEKHGFKLAGFRSFERPVKEETIEKVKKYARERKNQAVNE